MNSVRKGNHVNSTNISVNKPPFLPQRIFASYENELAKDMRRLEMGLTEAVVKINQACVRIWQLLVEWAYIAKKQTERPKLSQQYAMIVSVCLSHSHVLQRLQDGGVLAKLVQKEGAGWGGYMPLVENWYNQFVKNKPAVQHYLAHPITPVQDQQLLVFLIEDIIFSEETIQSFFSDLDLRWATHKRIVKKLVHQGLSHFIKNSEKGPSLGTFGSAVHWESEQCFYTDLVHRTLQRDEELEALIAQKAKNWTVDRIMLLIPTWRNTSIPNSNRVIFHGKRFHETIELTVSALRMSRRFFSYNLFCHTDKTPS